MKTKLESRPQVVVEQDVVSYELSFSQKHFQKYEEGGLNEIRQSLLTADSDQTNRCFAQNSKQVYFVLLMLWYKTNQTCFKTEIFVQKERMF